MRTRWMAAVLVLASAVRENAANANGFEQPVDLDRPAPPSPERPLPFPVVEEAAPTAAAIGPKDLPRDAVFVSAPMLASGSDQKNAAGAPSRAFEGVVIHQSRVASGKVSLP